MLPSSHEAMKEGKEGSEKSNINLCSGSITFMLLPSLGFTLQMNWFRGMAHCLPSIIRSREDPHEEKTQ